MVCPRLEHIRFPSHMSKPSTEVEHPTCSSDFCSGLDNPGKTHGVDFLVLAWPKPLPGSPVILLFELALCITLPGVGPGTIYHSWTIALDDPGKLKRLGQPCICHTRVESMSTESVVRPESPSLQLVLHIRAYLGQRLVLDRSRIGHNL